MGQTMGQTMEHDCENCGKETEHDVLSSDKYGTELTCGVCGDWSEVTGDPTYDTIDERDEASGL